MKKQTREEVLRQNGFVISKVLSHPGPTNSIFDVLAAAMNLSTGTRAGILGFAGGGVVAPLRAMGGRHDLAGVDLDDTGYKLFCEVSDDWRGAVKFSKADATEWLHSQRLPFDVLLEDLSIPRDDRVFKPFETFDTLPQLTRAKLNTDGLAVFNLLPDANIPWPKMFEQVSQPFRYGIRISIHSFLNQVLVLSDNDFLQCSSKVEQHLAAIQSAMSENIEVYDLL